MRFSRRGFCRRILAASIPMAASAQDPVFTADSRVVILSASVRDASGMLLPHLDKEDFTLTDNGQPAEIRYFSREVDLPLTIGLLIDTSRSQFEVLERERRGAYAFLERVLRPERDRAFVMKFDVKVGVLCRPTAELVPLQKALSEADFPLKNSQNSTPVEPKKNDYAVGTRLRDCVKQASDGIMRAAAGRKALLLLTDGVDAGSRHTLTEAIESAQRSETLVYSILYAAPRRPENDYRQKGLRTLTELANQTGGGFFMVSSELPLEKVLDEIQAELRTQYSIGFIPAAGRSGEYRKLRLTATREGLTVRTREGYFAK